MSGTVAGMQRLGLAAFAVLVAILLSGCGTVSVEVTSRDDSDKIDVDRDRSTSSDPAGARVGDASVPSAPQSGGAALGALGEGSTAVTSSLRAPTTTVLLEPTSTTTMAVSASSTTAPSTTAPSTSAPSTTSTSGTTTTKAPVPLEYHQVDHGVFAVAGDLELRMPVTRYETVGFHESGHDGAFQLEVRNISDWMTLASRGRGTGSRTAADIVVPVGEAVLSPVDGTVIRAGTYTLYCVHTDNFVVIEPTGRPGWEVKVFHFEGLAVGVGDTVFAASTRLGSGGKVLPFESQVDEFTAEPSNPHVHVEVIDTSIPDRPSSGGGC